MNEDRRQAHHTACRNTIVLLGERLERLRQSVERHDPAERQGLERTLDALRGQRNRVMARAEEAFQTSDDAWPFARARADQAIAELVDGLDALEARLSRAAA